MKCLTLISSKSRLPCILCFLSFPGWFLKSNKSSQIVCPQWTKCWSELYRVSAVINSASFKEVEKWPRPKQKLNSCVKCRTTYIFQTYTRDRNWKFIDVIFLFLHNMFRPLRAILRWNNLLLTYLEKAIDITTDPLFTICLLLSIYTKVNAQF
jgi:hypothetical protein